jgi:hypothetical protein
LGLEGKTIMFGECQTQYHWVGLPSQT